MTIEPAQSADLAGVQQLLQAAALPIEDLTADSLQLFLVAREDSRELTGAIGLERHGDVGLLRSLVVTPGLRGRGLGGELVYAAERRAHQLGLSALYLLTTTAASFFAARGFRVVERAEVPGLIQASKEFASLCPASATVMVKP